MKGIDELYYITGRLEGLLNNKQVKAKELDFIKEILEENLCFQETNQSDFDIEDEEFDYEYDDYDDVYYDDEPYMIGDPRFDRNENPWIDVFGEGEEAETAYWNTQ